MAELLSDGSPAPAQSGGGTGDPGFNPTLDGWEGSTPGSSAPAATPQAVELTNDSWIKVPGEKDPVKYSEYVARFVPKSDFTRKQQESAQQLRAAQAEVQKRDQALREYQARQTSAEGAQNPLNTFLGELKGKTYIDGPTAASMIENLYNGGIVPLAQAIQQRDQLLTLLYNRLTQVDQTASKLGSAKTEADFEARLRTARETAGLPDDEVVYELGKDIYLSHEGEDLDHEFPNMLKARWDSIQRVIRASDASRVKESRQRLFTPSTERRGGNATPSKPLKGGFKDAKQLADDLWPALSGGQT